jgi:hypothetical protein
MEKRRLPKIPIALLGAALAGIGLGCDAPDSAGGPSASDAGQSEVARELGAALRDPDAFLRARRLAELLPTLGPEALPDIQETIRRRRRDMGEADFELVMRRWAELDPAGAVARSLELEATRHRTVALHIAVETWAKADPEAAREGIAEALQSPLADVAQTAQQALVRGWFQTDRPGLEAYIQSLGHGPLQLISLSRFALDLSQTEGADALIRWAEAIPESAPAYKHSAYSVVTAALISAHPDAVDAWCEAQCDSPYGGPAMRALVAEDRLNRGVDGESVIEWLALDTRGEAGRNSLVGAFRRWARGDRDSALAWMQGKLAEGTAPWLPVLYDAYAQELSQTQPVEAIEWTQHIADESDREDVIVGILTQWLSRDPEAAESWLSQSSLPEQTRLRAHAGAHSAPAPQQAPKPQATAAP